jgi:hypothetical protein
LKPFDHERRQAFSALFTMPFAKNANAHWSLKCLRAGDGGAETLSVNPKFLVHNVLFHIPSDPWFCYIYIYYGVPWIPSIYPIYVSIYTSTMDPSWV